MEKVLCEGVADLVEESVVDGKWVGIAEKMAVRYLGPDGPTYANCAQICPNGFKLYADGPKWVQMSPNLQ